jgi:hypothetical protein
MKTYGDERDWNFSQQCLDSGIEPCVFPTRSEGDEVFFPEDPLIIGTVHGTVAVHPPGNAIEFAGRGLVQGYEIFGGGDQFGYIER